MKICFLVPSADYMKQAGARIRYLRIENHLRLSGHVADFVEVQKLADQRQYTHDVYIISKCFDTRAHLVADMAKVAGKQVGVDLFDDYFSQTEDSRLSRFRLWLKTLLISTDFILCSTPAMQDLASHLAPGMAVHVLNDPCPPVNPGSIRQALRHKLKFTMDKKQINIGWFGIGDNPYFPVGLSDVAAYGGELARLCGRGYEVRLSILTNQRALTTDVLAMLHGLPVPYTLDDWTVGKEVRLLENSLVVFLPVNAQAFSVAKSLNRVVTALTAGVQVISSGYPLYEKFGPFIYRDPASLLADLDRQSLAFREKNVDELVNLLNQNADPAREADGLVRFLERLRPHHRQDESSPMSGAAVTAAVIHGKESGDDVHDFVCHTGMLSIAGPFCQKHHAYDIRFIHNEDTAELELYIAEKIIPGLQSRTRSFLGKQRLIHTTGYRRLDPACFGDSINLEIATLKSIHSLISYTASNATVQKRIIKVIQSLFPGIHCYYSETGRLPWWTNSLESAGTG